jgi:hypothetical protein
VSDALDVEIAEHEINARRAPAGLPVQWHP